MDNGLILYYDTPHTARVSKIRIIVVPAKFRKVAMSKYHVSLLAGQSHDKL